MSVFKCKMCGGTIEFNQGETVGVCDSCGTKQTLPRLDDDKKANLYDRANHFRRNNDFDKAMGIYEQILNEDSTDAEAYWSLVLCRYGIEYVEDPTTHKRVPTVNRTQYTSIFSVEDYKSALNYADSYQRMIYEDEAKTIDDIQKGILEISQKEEPFDVFICYKETDANGRRTPDSVLANDLYHQLTQEGFKVFFSRITLEDKLGTAYEPYIFAALNSSKVMVVLGTKPEYFNAVWVKNEWSRYLALVKNSNGKKMLIPAYKDMDPYDLPEEFSHLQAQDMSKLGFMQDLIRGIKKIIGANEAKEKEKETFVVQQSGANTTTNAQIKRGNIAIEDHDYEKADSFFEEALNLDPECADAYIGKMLVRDKKPGLDSWVAMQKKKYISGTTERLEACPADDVHISKMVNEYAIEGYLDEETIKNEYVYDRGYDSVLSCRRSQKEKQLSELSEDRLLVRAKQYASGSTKKHIEDAMVEIASTLDQRITEAQKEDEVSIACVKAEYGTCLANGDKRVKEMNIDAQNRREQCYRAAADLVENAVDVPGYVKAWNALEVLNNYKDINDLIVRCREEIDRLNEEERQEKEREAAIRKKEMERAARKRKIIAVIVAAIAVVCIAIAEVVTKVIVPNNKYNSAVALMENGDYEAAISSFEALEGHKDSAEKIEECNIAVLDISYNSAVTLMGEGKYEEAISAFEALGGYKDSSELASNILSEHPEVVPIGETLCFGTYEQDNDTSNGKEDIEWIVLAKENDRMLLISKYGLDCQPYNTSNRGVTWSTCSLRTWLNGTFIDTAFTAEEKEKIATTMVTADKNPEYSTEEGNDTQDKIFLLSILEAEKYFSNDLDRQCEATAYAEAQGAYVDSYNENCWWWMRSPGDNINRAARIGTKGTVIYCGDRVSDDCGSVRPALWINIES